MCIVYLKYNIVFFLNQYSQKDLNSQNNHNKIRNYLVVSSIHLKIKQKNIEKLTGLSEKTKIELKEAREQLSLPPDENELPNILADKKSLKKLQAEQELLISQAFNN